MVGVGGACVLGAGGAAHWRLSQAARSLPFRRTLKALATMWRRPSLWDSVTGGARLAVVVLLRHERADAPRTSTSRRRHPSAANEVFPANGSSGRVSVRQSTHGQVAPAAASHSCAAPTSSDRPTASSHSVRCGGLSKATLRAPSPDDGIRASRPRAATRHSGFAGGATAAHGDAVRRCLGDPRAVVGRRSTPLAA